VWQAAAQAPQQSTTTKLASMHCGQKRWYLLFSVAGMCGDQVLVLARVACVVKMFISTCLSCAVVKNVVSSMGVTCHGQTVGFSVSGMCQVHKWFQHGLHVFLHSRPGSCHKRWFPHVWNTS
jgi:hypothetical protein